MFAMVFTSRYLDLFLVYVSLYNSVMKVMFILLSYLTVFFIYFKYKLTASEESDSFRMIFILAPVAGLAFLISWTFSIYLEAVAILPQLFMISKTGEAETITTHYLFALGCYRALYIVNWVYRYHTEHFYDPIAIVAGCVQTILYLDFFYLYVTRVLKGRRLILPV